MTLTLGCHLDALYLTLNSEQGIDPDWKFYLQGCQDAAITARNRLDPGPERENHPGYPMFEINNVPGGRFYCRTYGSRGYSFRFYNSHMEIFASFSGPMPALRVQFRAICLYEYDLRGLAAMVEEIGHHFLLGEFRETVSRVDLAVDFQHPKWEQPALQDVVYRGRKFVLEGEQGLIQTATYGSRGRSMQVQIYAKSLEMLKSGKEWMKDVWTLASDGAYNEDEPVFRVEVRFFRDLLATMQTPEGMGINTLEHLENSLGDLREYAVSADAGGWFRVCDPGDRREDHHSERRAAADWWIHVVDAFGDLVGSEGRVRVMRHVCFQYAAAIKRGVAYLARAAAIARISKWNPHMRPDVFAKNALYGYFAEDGQLWADLVNRKQSEMVGNIPVAEELSRRRPAERLIINKGKPLTATHPAYKADENGLYAL